MRRQLKFESSILRSLAVGLSVTLVGVVLAFVAASRDSGVLTTTLQTLASVLLSIGVVTFLYDLFVRRAFTRELFDAVQVSESLTNASLQRVCEQLEMDWGELLVGCSSFSVLLLDPSSWVEREWNHVLAAGRLRAIEVVGYLPDPGSDGFPVLATQLGFERGEFVDRVNRARSVLEDTWKNALRSDPPLRKGSSLRLRLYPGVPGYGIVAADHSVVLLAPGSFDKSSGNGVTLFHFTGKDTTFPASWLAAQLGRLTELPNAYADDVR